MGRKEYLDEIVDWSAEFLARRWEERGLPDSIQRRYMWAAEKLCESPIECRMLAGLIMCPFGFYDDPNVVMSKEEIVSKDWPTTRPDSALIVPQAQIRGAVSYRVDFLVILNTRHVTVSPQPSFVVECDGHDFHEKTKEQAARDKKRDRDIQELGIPVFRFTGSEIHRDLDACVDQLDGYAFRLLSKLWGA